MVENVGWTPVLATEREGEGFIVKVEDWLGAGCNKPASKLYLTEQGYSKNRDSAMVIETKFNIPIRTTELFKPLEDTEDE